MGVEHVLRECTYECNMMSSPFYHASSLPLSLGPSVRHEEKGCLQRGGGEGGGGDSTLGQAVSVCVRTHIQIQLTGDGED